jgi:hypothetical protein
VLTADFAAAICASGAHCATCRDRDGGRAWRRSNIRVRGMQVEEDWPCDEHPWAAAPGSPAALADALNLLLEAYRPPPIPCAPPRVPRGVIICAGGETYLLNALVAVRNLRHVGCRLPIQIWHIGPGERVPWLVPLFAGLGVEWVDALAHGYQRAKYFHFLAWKGITYTPNMVDGFRLKAFALAHCDIGEVFCFDADVTFISDPTPLLDHPEYKRAGCVLWPEIPGWSAIPAAAWPGLIGRQAPKDPPGDCESGQMLWDRRRCWQQVWTAWRMNDLFPLSYRACCFGDKTTFIASLLRTGHPYAMPAGPATSAGGVAHVQNGLDGNPLIHHRVGSNKWKLP